MRARFTSATSDSVWVSVALALALMLGTTSIAPAADPSGSNALNREEISEGWILLFDGETRFGWEDHEGAQATIQEDALHVVPTPNGWVGTTTAFADLVLRFEYRSEEPDGSCEVFLRCGSEGDPRQTGSALKFESINPAKAWNQVEIRAEGAYLEVRGNGHPAAMTEIPEAEYQRSPRGRIGLAAQGKTAFRNIALKPLGAESIFNAEDLTGWSVLPDRKSVFRVTPEGWLNIRDGNGQIETQDVWDDFVLQLDVISNGDHLNSGVFFRGDPGGFWTGYESQVRNEWITEVTLKDGTQLEGSYTEKGDRVEVRRCEDDGRRLKPTDDVTTVSKGDVARVVPHRERPVDFGTGGVYNRQPARRVVANDGEWFTKTIVASGNHIAVWVEGDQVSDFTDRRQRGNNARTHQRLEAGTISLQGHDPTTDLSFRNLRVAPLPKRP